MGAFSKFLGTPEERAEHVADRMDDAVDSLKHGDRPAAEATWRDINYDFDADERAGGRSIFARRHGI
ncbi:hypothetical protein [Streptomyces sp. NBC_00212]|uniref:hypothetical protein n=1 Tax=Streptomyces sp. NBC_00212 TaxID=2975684 RepID=UPI003250B422